MSNRVRIIIERDGKQIFSCFSSCFVISAADLVEEGRVDSAAGALGAELSTIACVLKSSITAIRSITGSKFFFLAVIRALFLPSVERKQSRI